MRYNVNACVRTQGLLPSSLPVLRDLTSYRRAVFACASRRFREKRSMQKRPRPKPCMYAFVAYETRSLRNSSRKRFCMQQAKGRCSGIWQAIDARSLHVLRGYSEKSDPCKKDRVQKRACRPSWRTKEDLSAQLQNALVCKANLMGISRSSNKRSKRCLRKRFEPLPNQEI